MAPAGEVHGDGSHDRFGSNLASVHIRRAPPRLASGWSDRGTFGWARLVTRTTSPMPAGPSRGRTHGRSSAPATPPPARPPRWRGESARWPRATRLSPHKPVKLLRFIALCHHDVLPTNPNATPSRRQARSTASETSQINASARFIGIADQVRRAPEAVRMSVCLGARGHARCRTRKAASNPCRAAGTHR